MFFSGFQESSSSSPVVAEDNAITNNSVTESFPLLYRFYLKDYKNKHVFIHILTGLLTDFLLIILLITMTMAKHS